MLALFGPSSAPLITKLTADQRLEFVGSLRCRVAGGTPQSEIYYVSHDLPDKMIPCVSSQDPVPF